MLAIHTKYIPASKTKSSRIKAISDNGQSVIVSFNHSFDGHLVHFEAVKALVIKHKLTWDISNMCYGGSSDGKGYTFVFADSKV
jgi:FKBP-type peptidyl-prolyl cis-trans isomerase 2